MNDLGSWFTSSTWAPVAIVVAVLLAAGLVGGRVAEIAKWLGLGLLAVFLLGYGTGAIKANVSIPGVAGQSSTGSY